MCGDLARTERPQHGLPENNVLPASLEEQQHSGLVVKGVVVDLCGENPMSSGCARMVMDERRRGTLAKARNRNARRKSGTTRTRSHRREVGQSDSTTSLLQERPTILFEERLASHHLLAPELV